MFDQILKYFIYCVIISLLGCSFILENDSIVISDENNDGYDDRDILFLQKLIDNSQGYNSSPDPDLNPTDIGEQIWVEGRLRSLKHTGGLGEFFLYGDIPPEIKDVEFLNKLVFVDNFFTTIADEILELKNLSEIILNNNRFIGEVPEGLWINKNNLKNLSIHNNDFSSISESVCDVYNEITNFIISHNNLCDIPDCISDAGIQSCNCYDYITMDICIEPGNNLSCNETVGEIIENCPLQQFWGESQNSILLNTIDPNSCVSWSGDCNLIHEISEEDIVFLPDGNGSWNEGEEFIDDNGNGQWDEGEEFIDVFSENTCIDCNGNSCDGKLQWLGDYNCDENNEINFSCPEFNCDFNDCGFYSDAHSGCYCQRDCLGNCFNNIDCFIFFGQYGYDCCIDDGTCQDLTGDGIIKSGIGDGYCDDGSRAPYLFNCNEMGGFNYNCDGGDCGVWNPTTGQCEPIPGQIIKYRDFY